MSIPNLPFKVKSTFSWAGEEEGDLGFLEGEIVEVYSIVDESWWSGKLRRNGAEGIFPREYVTIMEDQLGQSTSSKPNTPTPTVPGTPIKSPGQAFYKSPNTSFNMANTSVGSTKMKHSPSKVYPRSPGNGQSMNDHYHQNELLQLQQRELEIEKFKLLKQQQHFQVKKLQEQHKRMSYQNHSSPPPPPPPAQSQPYSPEKSHSKMKSSTSYQSFSPYHNKSNSLSFENKAQSNIEISSQPKVKPPPLAHSHTIDTFSPSHSPKVISPRDQLMFHDVDDDEITQKRKQLERELKQLKLIEKNRKSQYGKSISRKAPASSGEASFGSSSYVSEDLSSSKKNYRSREDLSKKMSRYTDENEDEDEDFHDQYANTQAQYVDIDDEELDGSASPPPPPPPKHTSPLHKSTLGNSGAAAPYDSDDFRFTDEELHRISQMQQEELKNSIKSLQSDVLNLSELSATSAGSFMRHKYENELTKKQLGNVPEKEEPPSSPTANKDTIDTIFQEKKNKQNIFQKLLKKKSSDGAPENLMEAKLQQQSQKLDDGEVIHWTTFKSDLNRMNSLTTHSKHARTKRIVREERSLIIKPLEFVSDINTNEVLGDIDEKEWDDSVYSSVSFSKIQSFVQGYSIQTDLNDFIADVSVKLANSKLGQIRAVLLHLIKFRIIEEELEDGGRISQQKPKLQELMKKGEGSIFQLNYLFKKMLDALRIPSEIVLGFWKRPNEFYHNEQYVLNHCWLSILLDDQFFIMDMYNFANGASVCNIQGDGPCYNEFYFLSRPLSVVSTHIPSIIDLQHVVPPIDQNIAFYLPRMYSGFYTNRLKFRNFNNALTRLTDLEFFELELEIPTDVEIFTLIKTSKVTTNELTLSQVYWSKSGKQRIAKIKAILPESESIGVLQIFSGPKGLQKHFDNVHELSIVIPLYHSGSYKPCKFVPRFPTVQSQNNDLYIKQPQTSKIIVKNAYNFEILQHPSLGLNSGSGVMNLDFKIVIESPTGKYFKLTKLDQANPFGVYENNIKCTELGLYRGLVIGDSGNSWYVFAQWECVPGMIKN